MVDEDTLILGGVALAAVYFLTGPLRGAGETADNVGGFVGNVLGGATDFIADAAGGATDWYGDYVGGVGNRTNDVVDGFGEVYNSVLAVPGDSIESSQNIIGGTADAIGGTVDDLNPFS